ncbi:hypothetical protein VTK56DRAFT_7663 [Thermocarpiscus australiensis]
MRRRRLIMSTPSVLRRLSSDVWPGLRPRANRDPRGRTVTFLSRVQDGVSMPPYLITGADDLREGDRAVSDRGDWTNLADGLGPLCSLTHNEASDVGHVWSARVSDTPAVQPAQDREQLQEDSSSATIFGIQFWESFSMRFSVAVRLPWQVCGRSGSRRPAET